MARLTENLLPLYPEVNSDDVHWLLVDLAKAVMPELGSRLGQSAMQLLERRRVDVRLGVSVTEVTATQVTLTDGTVLDCSTLIWAITSSPCPPSTGGCASAWTGRRPDAGPTTFRWACPPRRRWSPAPNPRTADPSRPSAVHPELADPISRRRDYDRWRCRRIFSRLPQVDIEHHRRRPLRFRNSQPHPRPGQRVTRARRSGSWSSMAASWATASLTARTSWGSHVNR
jgi:hypothetical protein